MFAFYNNEPLLRQMIEKASANHNNPYFAQSKIIDLSKEVPSSLTKKVEVPKEPEVNEAPKPKPKRKPAVKKINLVKKTKQSLTEQEIIDMYNKLKLSDKKTDETESEEEVSPKIIKRSRAKVTKNKKLENNDD